MLQTLLGSSLTCWPHKWQVVGAIGTVSLQPNCHFFICNSKISLHSHKIAKWYRIRLRKSRIVLPVGGTHVPRTKTAEATCCRPEPREMASFNSMEQFFCYSGTLSRPPTRTVACLPVAHLVHGRWSATGRGSGSWQEVVAVWVHGTGHVYLAYRGVIFVISNMRKLYLLFHKKGAKWEKKNSWDSALK